MHLYKGFRFLVANQAQWTHLILYIRLKGVRCAKAILTQSMEMKRRLFYLPLCESHEPGKNEPLFRPESHFPCSLPVHFCRFIQFLFFTSGHK